MPAATQGGGRRSNTIERLTTRNTMVGDNLPIRRALPNKVRRMIGAWCFLDHAGPVMVKSHNEFRVGPHPHIGLQTFTWMIEGEILHRDSLGFEQVLRPGQVNLMTAGNGIAHSEESLPMDAPTRLHMAQLWIALPEPHRHGSAAFQHYPTLPVLQQGGFTMTLLAGKLLGHTSPVQVYSPMLGLDLTCNDKAETQLPLNHAFEYGALVLDGQVTIAGETLESGTLLYLGTDRTQLAIQATTNTRLLLLGGVPFNEKVLLWWNFVARSEAEIIEATNDWNEQSTRFGEVQGYQGERLVAPSTDGMHFHK
ncbi:MAG: pirin family protein [Steroidobacteraceae bacterium]